MTRRYIENSTPPGLQNSEIFSQMFSGMLSGHTPSPIVHAPSPLGHAPSPLQLSPESRVDWPVCGDPAKPTSGGSMDLSYLAFGGTRVAVQKPEIEQDLGTTADGQIIISFLR